MYTVDWGQMDACEFENHIDGPFLSNMIYYMMPASDKGCLKSITPLRERRAFNLLELLVVIALIAVLVSILLPVVAKVREQSLQIDCLSNMHQWGLGLQARAADKEGEFPPDLDAAYLSWVGHDVKLFAKNYLQNLGGFTTTKVGTTQSHAMYCPTQQWHRWVRQNTAPIASTLYPGESCELVGYFYLPYRALGSMDYSAAGIKWVQKKKIGANAAPKAPILSDIIQTGSGSWSAPAATGGIPFSSHLERRTNMPRGGNFLFEDGHVAWYPMSDIMIGGNIGGQYSFFYKIPIQ